MQPADQLRLVIGLPEIQLEAIRVLFEQPAERVEVLISVHVRFAAAKSSEVWSVQYEHPRHGFTLAITRWPLTFQWGRVAAKPRIETASVGRVAAKPRIETASVGRVAAKPRIETASVGRVAAKPRIET